jgi:hypothetical protein
MPIVTWATRKGLSFQIENYVVLKKMKNCWLMSGKIFFEYLRYCPANTYRGHKLLCTNKLSGASGPDQLIYKNVTWNNDVYCSMCLQCYLYYSYLWCVSVWFTSTQDLGLWIYSQIWAGQVWQSQAKPSQQRGKPSEASQAMWRRGNMRQSTFGNRLERTHSQQCQQCLSPRVCANQQTLIDMRIM